MNFDAIDLYVTLSNMTCTQYFMVVYLTHIDYDGFAVLWFESCIQGNRPSNKLLLNIRYQ